MFPGSPPAPGNGPCITEPEDGTLFPNNWAPPRVAFSGAGGKVVQIRMTADNQANALVAYTMSDRWVLPASIWTTLRGHQTSDAVTVTVWVAGGGASAVRFSTAPVGAQGTVTFESVNPAAGPIQPVNCYSNLALCAATVELRGFTIGDASTVRALGVDQVVQKSRDGGGNNPEPVTCIGCHAVTPDPNYVSIIDHYAWRAAVASVTPGFVGDAFGTLTPGGMATLLQPGWGPFTYIAGGGGWSAGRRIGIASLGFADPTVPDHSNGPDQNDSPHLAWINLEAPNAHVPQATDQLNWAYPSFALGAGVDSGNSLGIIARTGDPYGAATPSWSHDGTTIAYASTNASISGRLNIEATSPMESVDPRFNATTQNPNPSRQPGLTNLYQVPWNGGMGGAATPIAGAATAEFEEYYPAHSPDDRLIAFTRVPAGETMYVNPDAEIAVIAAGGAATATRLAANDPPACTGKTSPGVNNHWPRWAPDATSVGGRTYYWLVFSSNRAGIPPVQSQAGQSVALSQIYVAPVVVSGDTVQVYPAIYLWNQPADRLNTTPAWGVLDLPPAP
jgi:hypothetical protein